QSEFTASLEHAAQLHGRQPERTQQQTQAAETLERRKVSVLHGKESFQSIAARLGVKAVVAKRVFECLPHLGFRLPLRVDQEEPVAVHLGKQLEKVCFADDHVSLKDAVLQHSDDLQIRLLP